MKYGQCPHCGSQDVYAGSAGKPGGSNAFTKIPVTYMASAMVEHYVCTQCGYHEAYVQDAKSLDNIRKRWRRVKNAKADKSLNSTAYRGCQL